MADILCGYTADRDETLISYLYGEIEPAQRRAFEAHLATCDRCRHELSELQGVRGQLQAWDAPEPARPFVHDPPTHLTPPFPSRHAGVWGVLREIPAWSQIAAALLFLGLSARIANLDVRYDQNGIAIHTGWARTVGGSAAETDAGSLRRAQLAGDSSVGAPWQADLVALEGRLRTELYSSPAGAATPRSNRDLASANTAEGDLIHQVRTLVRESERKQQNELALRVAEVMREFDTKRGTDLVNINQTLRTMQSDTGIEVLKQREALSRLDYLVRTSGQQR